MQKRYVAVVIILLISIISIFNAQKPYFPLKPINIIDNQNYKLNVVLVPLDSRPACTQFVVDLAKIANIKIITPPESILDNYKTPADKQALRSWLLREAKTADAAIVSIDMLIHGGLLSSRLSTGTSQDANEVIALLTKIHQDRPYLPIHAFSIIPRLLIADSSQTVQHQKNMLKYSTLKDQIYTFENPVDIEALEKLEQQIPPEIIARYNSLYKKNIDLNLALVDLAEKNILTSLVLGQDDGQPFGMPNIAKHKLKHHLTQNKNLFDKVFITRGTDEVALTIVGKIASHLNSFNPKVYVAYSDAEAPQIVMPYMPHSVASTAREKIKLVGGIQVEHPDLADFILFIHIGTKSNINILPSTAQTVQNYINQGYKVALVDLSENFLAEETVFSYLLQQDTKLNRLIAYAGWNTTSNSIGTAVTQATVFTATLPNTINDDRELLKLYKDNLTFLTARFLDDWYYLKEVQPFINNRLKASIIDPYNLGSHYAQTNTIINQFMQNNCRQLFNTKAFRHPIEIKTAQGKLEAAVTSIKLQTHLPWERTFEIYLKPEITLSEINSK
ncbi:DUF4127 family protein [Dendrosporobacter sp. 1207_IL3150]|uniref:DUF4127 family protein n=1 Tax=Dendrosporobacter sp. 1207_IL3150 TaxID=3084054 RepID=UPI002FD9F3B7